MIALEALRGDKGVKYLLHKSMARVEEPRSNKIVHASDLTQTGRDAYCPRQVFLGDKTGLKPEARLLPTETAWIFAHGRMIQDLIVDQLAEVERAICDWRCMRCGRVHQLTTKPKVCSACGNERGFAPEESRFTSVVSSASCGIDVFVKVDDCPKIRIVEIKSISKDQFWKMTSPLAEHTMRTNFYMRIVEESGHPFADRVDTQNAYVLYASKGVGAPDSKAAAYGFGEAKSPFREYLVTRDDAATDHLSDLARKVKAWREQEVVPDRICSSIVTHRAQNCYLKGPCFAPAYSS